MRWFRAKVPNLLQLAAKPVESELQPRLLQRALGETRLAEERTLELELKLCPGFSQVWEMGCKEAKRDRLSVQWCSVYPHANIFSFLISLYETTHLWFVV